MNKPRFANAETRVLDQFGKLRACAVREILESVPQGPARCLHNGANSRL